MDVVFGEVGGDGEGVAFDFDEVGFGALEVFHVGLWVEGGAHEYEDGAVG